jgi:hypothetical protein
MKELSLLIFLVIFTLISSSAQSVLIEENVKKYDLDKPTYGPNLRHFTHFYIGYGFIVDKPRGNGIQIQHDWSHTLIVGYRYKLKIFNFLAIGTDFNYYYMVYYLKQNSSKTVPNSILHDKEKLKFNNLGAEAWLRINFGRRGNYMGNFMDFGAFYNWGFSAKHFYQDRVDDKTNPYMAKVIRVTNRDLNYVEPFNYGVRARIGFNRFVIAGTYRLSNLFTQDFRDNVADVELPRFSIGLQFGLHK